VINPIKKIHVSPIIGKKEALGMIGNFIEEDSIKILIQEDCDVYTEDGSPLLFLRKNVVSYGLAKMAYESLRIAATQTDNRGNAAEGESGYVDGNTRRYAKVNSGVIGYYDRYVRIPYCRKTAFNEKQLEKFKNAYPYIKIIDETLKEVVPDRYEEQKNIIKKTNPDFYIKGTVFTTVTVNKNYRTALHVDKGDYKLGFGTLSVLSAGKYSGAFTVIPRFGIAVDCRSRDIAFFDVHEVHGNTQFIGNRYERISVVCYYRENMYKCGSAEQELEIAKNRKSGDKLY
jgi:hypothetical protein